MSATDIQREGLHQRLLKKKKNNEAELRNKEGKDVQNQGPKGGRKRIRDKSHVTSTGVYDKEVMNQSLMITHNGEPHHSDALVRGGEIVTKMLKVGDSTLSLELPDAVLENASSSSISFQKKVKDILSLPGDLETVRKCSRSEGFEHMLGHLTQAYSWSIQLSEKDHAADKLETQLKKSYESEAKKLKTSNIKLEKLEKEMELLKSKAKDLEEQLINSRSKEEKLNQIISKKTKELEEAEERWYTDVVNQKLLKAKELFGNAYINLMDPWDDDPNVETPIPVVATTRSNESQTHDEMMVDEVSTKKNVVEEEPQDHLNNNA